MNFLQNDIILSLIGGIIFVLYSVIDNKVNNKTVGGKYYLKPLLIGSIICYITLYIKGLFTHTKLSDISESVLTGTPGF